MAQNALKWLQCVVHAVANGAVTHVRFWPCVCITYAQRMKLPTRYQYAVNTVEERNKHKRQHARNTSATRMKIMQNSYAEHTDCMHLRLAAFECAVYTVGTRFEYA